MSRASAQRLAYSHRSRRVISFAPANEALEQRVVLDFAISSQTTTLVPAGFWASGTCFAERLGDGGCPLSGLQSRCARCRRGSGMDSKLRPHRCRAKIARRAGLLTLSLAVAGCMALPAAALGSSHLDFSRDEDDGTGSVRTGGWQVCGFGCSTLASRLSLTRGDAVVGSTTSFSPDAVLPEPPEPGDVVHILVAWNGG